MNQSAADLLAAALKADSARPFVTFYDEASGERIELSVATFANWVAKTANLLVDGLGLGAGDKVHLDLPRHWQTPVWAVAAWSAGLCVEVSGNPADADVAVCGPSGLAAAQSAPEVVALSLKPMGAPFAIGALPAGVLDYGREVAGYGDRFSAPGNAATTPILTCEGRVLSAELVTEYALGRASTWGLGTGGRLLVAAELNSLDELMAATMVPLLQMGSVVLVSGAFDIRLGVIAACEHVSARSVGYVT